MNERRRVEHNQVRNGNAPSADERRSPRAKSQIYLFIPKIIGVDINLKKGAIVYRQDNVAKRLKEQLCLRRFGITVV
jgi:hypothetical protein